MKKINLKKQKGSDQKGIKKYYGIDDGGSNKHGWDQEIAALMLYLYIML
jgi:hypothetical protein